MRHGDFAFCAPFLPPAARAVWKNAADCGEAPVALPEDTLLALLRTASIRADCGPARQTALTSGSARRSIRHIRSRML
ncbi:MAG: hypothetical protein ACLT4C_01785 [Butyricicoccus sp.]